MSLSAINGNKPSSAMTAAAARMDRIGRLKQAVQTAKPGICAERALIWTAYFRDRRNRGKPRAIQAAEALCEVLAHKTVRIYPDELIVGNFVSRRVGGAIYPELHGVAMLREIETFPARDVNPLQVTPEDIAALSNITRFWMPRMLAFKTYRAPWRKMRFLKEQFAPSHYTLNELGGIAHIVPGYARLIATGTDGIIADARTARRQYAPGSENRAFLDAVITMAEGLARFGERYADEAAALARTEKDEARKAELELIARTCRHVPRHGARTFIEALQSATFAQIAINLESLDNGVSPGRMDQFLFPRYERDLARGEIDRERAKEYLSAFSIKMCEIIPVFSETATRMHGGLMSGQAVTIGGTDRDGRDATNELSHIFLEIADELRMRQPNFHARIHPGAPQAYLDRINTNLCGGANSPALYNDEVIVPALQGIGYTLEDARDYAVCGCVEPVVPGKTFGSTDAALFNLPVVLELALNRGRRFGARRRTGARTPALARMRAMEDVKAAFETQLAFQIDRLVRDLKAVELAHRKYHPTPLSSMLLEGCIDSATCSTAGGARYNGSGVQCVGPSDTGDSLYAIEQAVFRDRRLTLPALADMLAHNIPDDGMLAYLRGLGKFGNDEAAVDRYTLYAVQCFADRLAAHRNTRGGPYTTGLYSMTTHYYFGSLTGALPNGRRKGACFSSGIAPGNGMDRKGPTALFNSINRFDFTRLRNGINLNARFDRHTLRGGTGQATFASLLKTYFRRGGMQIQTNVLDPAVLIEARDNPDLHPNLLVRISGYSAYFNDLTPEMKDEIIRRSHHLAA